jgi:hypothetical protein
MTRKLTMIQVQEKPSFYVTAFHTCNIMKVMVLQLFVTTVKSLFQTISMVSLHKAYSVPF